MNRSLPENHDMGVLLKVFQGDHGKIQNKDREPG